MSDDFERVDADELGSSWDMTYLGIPPAPWNGFRLLPPKPGHTLTAWITCRTCNHVVTIQTDDGVIRYGDPRLCKHMGGKRTNNE